MFTGVVETVGKAMSLEEKRGQYKLHVDTGITDLQIGESLNINGIKFTVSESTSTGDAFLFVDEQLLTISNLKPGLPVNIERALRADQRLAGHYVQGQLDAVALVLNTGEHSATQNKISFAMDPKFGRYCTENGSISLNGVSATVLTQQETKLGEYIVTALVSRPLWKSSNLALLKIGEPLNIEVDMLAKYVERLFLKNKADSCASIPTQEPPSSEI